ncbi:GGDEF domain-containing protein [Pararhodospirillum oryzae]|uniref:diguanylate cyclase n=1 Tax=Pararhodospirillum oryzae TaxID=478448 RepID=A0A512HBZ0_9PROT|nr:GGDEF domain-containing protein [Pararhodospirillum oryzae]GEO82966.1 GGDEF domain-containing protein [Pararhodospirillum oryzae]
MKYSFAIDDVSKGQRLVILTCAAFLLVCFGFSYHLANTSLEPIPAFLPFYGGIVVLTDLLTAYLLAAQFRITRLLPLLALSGAYLYSGLIVIPQLLLFPGVVASAGILGAGPQSAIWLWVLWHGGFPFLVLLFALIQGFAPTRLCSRASVWTWMAGGLGLVLALVAGAIMLVTRGHDLLLPLVEGGNFALLAHSAPGQAVVLLNALALVAVALVTRGRSLAGAGLILALLASFLDVSLTLESQARFSLGWYVARVNSMVAASSVLLVFLYEVTWLYLRVTDLNESLSRMAFVDDLTRLANRRQFNERLAAEWARAQRAGQSLGLVMIDVDFFKKYNDAYGHPAGDECLRQVARAMEGAIRRPADLAARYGGEEFVLVLPDTGPEGALHVANAVGEAVRQLGLRHEAGTGLGVVTISLGVAATVPHADLSPETLKSAADQALYAAKEQGRNRAVLGLPLPSPVAVPSPPKGQKATTPLTGKLTPAGRGH